MFNVGVNSTTALLETFFGNSSSSIALISAIEAAYPLGENGISTPYDQASAIFTGKYWTAEEQVGSC